MNRQKEEKIAADRLKVLDQEKQVYEKAKEEKTEKEMAKLKEELPIYRDKEDRDHDLNAKDKFRNVLKVMKDAAHEGKQLSDD